MCGEVIMIDCKEPWVDDCCSKQVNGCQEDDF